MGCDWVLDHLSEYIDDELTPQEAQEVQAHLAGCLSCAQAYQELLVVVEELQEFPQPALPEGFHQALMAELQKTAQRMPATAPRGRYTAKRYQSLAAGILLLVAVGFGGLSAYSLRGYPSTTGAAYQKAVLNESSPEATGTPLMAAEGSAEEQAEAGDVPQIVSDGGSVVSETEGDSYLEERTITTTGGTGGETTAKEGSEETPTSDATVTTESEAPMADAAPAESENQLTPTLKIHAKSLVYLALAAFCALCSLVLWMRQRKKQV